MSDDKTNGYSLEECEGAKIDFRGAKMTLKISGSNSEDRYSLIEMIHPDTGPALQIHSNAPEAYYILDGSYSIICGDRAYQATLEILFLFQRIYLSTINQDLEVAKFW